MPRLKFAKPVKKAKTRKISTRSNSGAGRGIKVSQGLKKKAYSPKYWKNKLDKVFSLMVRSRGICDRCGVAEGVQLQAAHVITRSNLRLRWDRQNILCLCAKCHWAWHKEPLQSILWFNGVYADRAKYLLEHKDEVVKDRDYEQMYNAFCQINKKGF